MPVNNSLSDAKIMPKKGKGKKQSEEAVEWAWSTIADSSPSSHSAVFTVDGNYFFSIVGASVRIYSVATGKIVSTLSSSSSGSSASRVASAEGHVDIITAAVLNPENPFQLLTASLDGNIKIWDILDAALLRTICVGKPISRMCVHEKFKGKVFITVLTEVRRDKEANVCLDKGNIVIYRVSLTPKGTPDYRASKPCEVIRIGKSKAAIAMGISPSGSWLVVISGHKAYVSLTASPEMGFTKFVSPERLTCLAFHPTEDYFATGDALGQIRIWYCLSSQPTFSTTGKKRGQTTTLHWHAHAVSSLTFTPNGAYILSGGEESVLVIWQLHTGKKEFIPRLGSPISSITVRPATKRSEEEYLVGLLDGSYLFINAGSLSIKQRIARVALDTKNLSYSSFVSVPLTVHSKSSIIILPASHPSCLQLYSLDGANVHSELEVSPSNRVSRQDDKPIESSHVERVSIDSSGRWMVTIDGRQNGEDFSAEIALKFWCWESSTWTLNTRIDRPHGIERIMALGFSPTSTNESLLLMTAGQDGKVKTWSFQSVPNKKGQSYGYWVSRSSFSYRAEKPVDASWSPDASLLAVCHSQSLALYDPHSSLLVDYLVTSDIRNMCSIHFVGRSGRYLLVGAKRNAVLWDLVTRKLAWNYRSSADIAQVLAHPIDNLVTIILQPATDARTAWTSQILTFRPSSSKPFSAKALPFRFRSVAWFNIYNASSHSFIGLTFQGKVVLCGNDALALGTPPGEDLYSPREIDYPVDQVQKQSLFRDVFGNSAIPEAMHVPSFVDMPKVTAATQVSSRQRPQVTKRAQALSSFDIAAYLSPPIETLYSSLMESCLVEVSGRKEQWQVEEVLEAQEKDTDGMEIDPIQTHNLPPSLSTTSRIVADTEMEELVALFRSHITNKPPIQNKANGMSNGAYHAKGMLRIRSSNAEARRQSVSYSSSFPEASSSPTTTLSPSNPMPHPEKSTITNGIAPSHDTTTASPVRAVTRSSPSSYVTTPNATMASPVIAGKKRKKSNI